MKPKFGTWNKKGAFKTVINAYLESNNKIRVGSTCCWHIRKKGKNYLVLKNCIEGHELKMFFDFNNLEELLAFRFWKSKKIGSSIGGTFDFSILKNEVSRPPILFGDRPLYERARLIASLLKFIGLKEVYVSDIGNLTGDDFIKLMKAQQNYEKTKAKKGAKE